MVSDRIITSSQHWPRRVYCWGIVLLTGSHLGFALVANGFWGAMTCRTLTGSAVGPLMVGWILDLAGGQSVFGWGMAFAHAALVMVVGPLALLHYRPQALAGDHGAMASGAPVASPCVRA